MPLNLQTGNRTGTVNDFLNFLSKQKKVLGKNKWIIIGPVNFTNREQMGFKKIEHA